MSVACLVSPLASAYGATVFGPGRDTGTPQIIASPRSHVGDVVLFFVRDFDVKRDIPAPANLLDKLQKMLDERDSLPWVFATVLEELPDNQMRLQLLNGGVIIAGLGTGQLGTWSFSIPVL